MTDIGQEAERLKNQRDYNRRLADHQATVIDKLNAHITAQSARIEELEAQVAAARNEALIEAAYVAGNACLVPPDGGSPTEDEINVCQEAGNRILALMEEPTNG